MASVPKSLLHLRETLRLPRGSRAGRSSHRVEDADSTAEPSSKGRQTRASTDGLQQLIEESLWPMVENAFRDVEDHVEARFFQLGDLQVVLSRAAARGALGRDATRRLTLELWPAVGPRVLVVEWSGRRPYVVHRRDGDWLQRLLESSQQPR
ncbi:MAG: hypothetical protein ACREBN_09495 [Burkholderiaceae bacterium]